MYNRGSVWKPRSSAASNEKHSKKWSGKEREVMARAETQEQHSKDHGIDVFNVMN